MLDVRGLTKRYKNYLAVDRVDLTVEDGQVAILLGPNGAGKSTIIKSIAGLLKYDGEVFIQGHPAKSLEAKRVFAYVPEIPQLFDALTVAEHIEFIRRAYESDMSREEIDAMLDRFDLLDKKDKLGKELSKGMMQKISICCALVIKPSVILFDEPMVGLDPKAIKELKIVIKELKDAGTSVLLSTHMLEMVEGMWDVMYVMQQSHITGKYFKKDVGDKDLDDLFFSATAEKETSAGADADVRTAASGTAEGEGDKR